MKRILFLAVVGSLPACTPTGGIDACKYAGARRATYTTAIAAVDAYEATGQIAPYQMAMGRLAAQTALGVLNSNCPEPR